MLLWTSASDNPACNTDVPCFCWFHWVSTNLASHNQSGSSPQSQLRSSNQFHSVFLKSLVLQSEPVVFPRAFSRTSEVRMHQQRETKTQTAEHDTATSAPPTGQRKPDICWFNLGTNCSGS